MSPSNLKTLNKVLDYYGKKCSCCGEDNIMFLALDHIHNTGTKHAKEIGMIDNKGRRRSGTPFYRWVIKNNFPYFLQTLCFNCNCGKHRNGGVCPHKERQAKEAEGREGPQAEQVLPQAGPMPALNPTTNVAGEQL